MLRTLALVMIMLAPLAADAGKKVIVGNFSEGQLSGWEEKSFEGHTTYKLVDGPYSQALRAVTQGEASGLYKAIEVDLAKTPWLNWSWKITNIFTDNDEKTRAGDDYPARVYVVVSGGLFFWRTRAINYVWASHEPQGSQWDNAYTDKAKMVAVQSGEAKAGQWVQEKRNVRKDLENVFGEAIGQIDAVAVMVDGDNTGQSAESFFGDIYFSEKPGN
ncbi:MAG: DUF3047 domain-containing protein [Thiohalophilus sp.]|uniref:DUF3047 domain-containing protein n=1 Tax=Thiohalophilus sp. TaxID=3028392 RepID=UPI00286FFEC8|nr:DUF3047 domain-containing protein [Thiohalophilus sp.]MDR9436795.1 DUF3047 domain-containing protein [Thiohalophilus sp.]